MADILDQITESSDFRERRKEHLYADGYDITGAVSDFSVDSDSTEDSVPVYGRDTNISSTKINGVNVNLSVYEQNEKVNGFYALVNGLKPSKVPSNTIQQLKWSSNIKPVNLLVHRYSNDDASVISSMLVPGLQLGPSYPSGSADAKTTRAFKGKASIAKEVTTFVGAETLIRNTYQTTFQAPYAIPNINVNDVYAWHITGIYAPGNDLAADGMQREEVTSPTSGMFNASGVIGWETISTACPTLPSVTHAQIYYLRSGMSSTPLTDSTVAPAGMRGAIT